MLFFKSLFASKLKYNWKKVTSFILCLLFIGQQTCILPVIASTIISTDPTGIAQNGNTYNINPSVNSGNTGFRHYNQFNLSQGDIANLIFQMKNSGVDIERFVNLVDGRVNIDGIVNSMRENKFYNGHVLFISPNGMMIGSSGVLNVGSLTALAPTPMTYARFAAQHVGEGIVSGIANHFGITGAITIPGLTLEGNLAEMKAGDMLGNIDVKGKIIARGDVELRAKNIEIGNNSSQKAGIVAGVGSGQITKQNENIDIIMTTNAQTERLFNALVNNEVKSGVGFGNNNGKITIAAQSFKSAEVISPLDKLIIGGVEYLFDEIYGRTSEQLATLGLTQQMVDDAIALAKSMSMPSDAVDPASIDTDNKASVKVHNAILAAKDIDVSATSRVDYIAQKGNPAVSGMGSSAIGIMIQKAILGQDYDYEGARAKATVEIGSGSELLAKNDININSHAIANTTVIFKTLLDPMFDTGAELYYSIGNKTVSAVNILSGAKLSADNDIDIAAVSQNAQWIKLKNPTGTVAQGLGSVTKLPSVQVVVIKTDLDADTTANIASGANVKAKNLSVNALNVTNDMSAIAAVATVSGNAGVAVALTIKDANINTSAIIDAIIDTSGAGTVSVNAQNLHTSYTSTNADVKSGLSFTGKAIASLANSDIINLLTSKIGSVFDASLFESVTNNLPSVSAGVTVNNSTINTTAKIGKNAVIKADNINVNANTIDLTINEATANLSKEVETGAGQSPQQPANENLPSPGVAVIVNNQTNNTTAIIEDRDTKGTTANIKANNNLNINATLEQPMNESTFELALNLLQTGRDTVFGVGETIDAIGNAPAYIGSGEWDIRTLLQDVTNPASEVLFDIKNVKLDLSMSGLSSLGLKGFANNWAQSTSNNPAGGIGIAASVVVSDVLNNTTARLGDNNIVEAKNVVINSVNKVVQNNFAGDIEKIWAINGSTGTKSGMGGSILVEFVESNAKAEIGDGVKLTATENVNLNSANDQSFISLVVTGSKTTSGAAISGSVVVQDVEGSTESAVGASEITAKNLTVNAGEGKIGLISKASDTLFSEPFKDLDADKFQTSFDPDLDTPSISSYTGVDTSKGFITLKTPGIVKDGISNIMITGALATQAAQGGEGESGGSSSGVAVGASVGVSQFSRDVLAAINDGAKITLSESLNVNANSFTQGLNIALAGAFAGGVDMQKKPGFLDELKGIPKNAADKSILKIQSVLNQMTSMAGVTDSKAASGASSGSTQGLDQHGRPKMTVEGKEYVTDANGQYYNQQSGQTLKDSSGNAVKYQGSMGEGATGAAGAGTAGSNMAAALAGSVNAQINDSKVEAKVGNATISVGKDVNVSANQSTRSLNIGTGVAKGTTVGAGAAVNFVKNANTTNAILDGTKLTYTDGATAHQLNVKATENNDNIQVAIGVGVAKNGPQDTTTTVSVGGSFNADILENQVNATIKDAEIKTADPSKNNIAIDVNAENHSTSYKGAGAMAINIPTSGTTAVGAGMSGNINVIQKTTNSNIDNTKINNASSISVVSNKDATQPTERLVSAGVAGSVIAGGSSGYSFVGAIGADVFLNNINASITGSTITNGGVISVISNEYINNISVAGAINFSTAPSGVGVGIGTIVNVVNNDVSATIEDTTINKSNSILVKASDEEKLKFLAVNMGLQTGGGHAFNINAIVNVLISTIEAGIIDSIITNNATTVDVVSNYDSDIAGVTAAAAIATGAGLAVGGNLLSNVLVSNNTAKIEGADITTGGKLTVSADSDETIDVIPASVAVTTSGSAAVAANLGVNVVKNNTKASIDKSNKTNKSKISANGIEVVASDVTSSRSRGGTLAASGGTAGVGGSVLADIYIKDIDAYIDNSTISKGGNIKVDANSKNIFGQENPGSITASALTSSMSNNDYDASHDARFDQWEITFDAAGGSTVGVSGSIISKTVINDVNSYIGSGVTIEEAGTIDVLASNKTHASAIIGNVSAGGTAAVGGSIFANVNTSNVNAGIKQGAIIGSASKKVGKVNIDASSEQIFRSIVFVVGASGTASVNASINANVIVNTTTAYIEKGVNLYSKDSLSVKGQDSLDVESLNLAVSASGTAAVGGIAYVDVLANNVNAIIGKNSDTGTNISGIINADNDILVKAKNNQDFQANVAMIAASGVAAVSGVLISNTMASNVNAGIEEIDVTSNSGKIDVVASNGYNEKHKNQTTGFSTLLGKESIGTNDVKTSDLIPLVAVLNIAGSGTAAITGSAVANVVVTNVNAYVKNANISTSNGLNIDADSIMTTYDAVMGVAGSAFASIAATGVANVYSGKTIAQLANSTVKKGSVNLTADDALNLNTIIFTVAGSGTGASITAVTNVNTIVNNVIAEISDTDILAADAVDVKATNNLNINDIVVAGAGTGIGAAINAVPIANVFVGDTRASITNGSINGARTKVEAVNDIDTASAIVGFAVAGVGADVSGYVLTNVFDNDLDAYIKGTTITNAQSTNTKAESLLDMTGIIVTGGVTGVGASVLLNGIVSVINNNINSYIQDASITGGTIGTLAKQHTTINDNTASVSVTGIGNTTAVNALVHVFSNKLNSYIDNTSIVNAGDITVKADTMQDITNNNIGISGSGTSAVSANATVNVFETESRAYIDAKNKSISSTGKIDIHATDKTLFKNVLGLLVLSGGLAGGATVNVNVINNSIKSELLSSSSGSIIAREVDVHSDSTLGLNIGTASAAFGMAGIAGTVAITSIGDKFSSSESDSGLKTSDSIASANNSYAGLYDTKTYKDENNKNSGTNKTEGNFTYEKDGTTKSLENSYNLTTGTKKDGTVANVNANVTTTGANGLKVRATNTLKNAYDTTNALTGDKDFATITNAAVAGGAVGVGASVLVTDMKYNTVAQITGGTINAQNNGKVEVVAQSTVKARTNAIAATIGAVGIAGNAAVFKNKAKTTALVSDATIDTAGDVDVRATSTDSIDAKAITGAIGVGAVVVALSAAETTNEVTAKIHKSKIGNTTKAASIDLVADNTSTLISEMGSGAFGGYTFSALGNSATSNAIISAIVSGDTNTDSDIRSSGNINILARTGNITTETTMYVGSLALVSGLVSIQQSKTNVEFNALVSNKSKVSGNNVNIKTGIKNDDTDTAGIISAEVKSLSATGGLITASATVQDAITNANTNIKIDSGASVTATSSGKITLLSKLRRLATTGSKSVSISAVDIEGVSLHSKVGGKSTIEANGTLKAGTVDIDINDDNDAISSMFAGSISLIGVNINSVKSTVSTAEKITTGNINANTIEINSNTTKDAVVTNSALSVGLANIGVTTLETTVSSPENSGINMVGTVRNYAGDGAATTLTAAIAETANACNDSVSGSYGFVSGAVFNIKNTVNSSISNTIAGNIQANTISMGTTLNRMAKSNAASDTAGLGAVSVMNIESKIANGATTTVNGVIGSDTDGVISGNSGLSVTSDLNNTTEVYMNSNTNGLIAIASGYTKNTYDNTNKNVINFNSAAKINSAGIVKANATTTNTMAMTKNSSTNGFIAIKGGDLQNNINSATEINFDGSQILAKDIEATAKSTISTGNTSMSYDDSSGGFIASTGAKINNTITHSNSIKVKGGAKLSATRNIIFNTIANTAFHQYAKSVGRGAGVYNKAESNLTVTDNNNIDIDGAGTVVNAANNFIVNMDSNNSLTSSAHVEARHFAGQPSAYANLTLTVNNNMNVTNGASAIAGELVDINFLNNSYNNLTQYAYMFAEAAIASGNWGGYLTYTDNNKLNVAAGSKIVSLKDVDINYQNGNNILDSSVRYKKVSRILFGIPITSSGGGPRIATAHNNELTVNGTIEAGLGGLKELSIDKDGKITKADGFKISEYKIQDAVTKTSEETTNDAIASIQAEMDYLNAELKKLKDSDPTAESEAKKVEYKDKLDTLTLLLATLNNLTNTMTNAQMDAAIAAAVKTAAINAVYQSNTDSGFSGWSYSVSGNVTTYTRSKTEVSYSKLTDTDFNNLWNALKNCENETEIDAALANFRYNATKTTTVTTETYTVTVDNGNTTTSGITPSYNTSTANINNTGLSGYQLTAIKNSHSTELANVNNDAEILASFGDFTLTTYKGQFVIDSSEITDLKTSINSGIDTYSSLISLIDSQNSGYNSLISDYTSRITACDTEIKGLKANPLAGIDIQNASVIFENLKLTNGKITVSGLDRLYGTGNFINHSDTALVVNNYSSHNLIFNNIIFETGGSGLTINGIPYSPGKPIAYPYAPGHSVGYQTPSSGKDGITVNTYYDHNNPLDNKELIANIYFNGKIQNASGKAINVFNDSGDISFNNLMTSKIGNIIASQGNLIFNLVSGTTRSDFTLDTTSNIFAGKDVSITANNFVNNGKINAGNANRNITIDDTLYNQLTLDSNDVNNMPKTNQSTYLNLTNNIKAIKDADGNIHLYNTEATSGSLTINANAASGSGTMTYSDGYGTVNITNNTNHKVVVHNLTNNYELGESNKTATKQSFDSALTTITSNNAEVEFKGVTSTGNKGAGIDGAGTLTVNAKTISVPHLADAAGKIANIDATGTVNMKSTDGFNIAGWIKNRKGVTTLENTTSGDLILSASSAKVQNNAGTLTLKNSGTGGITVHGNVDNTNGNTTVTNDGDTGITVYGTIKNTGTGNMKIENTNTSGSAITTMANSTLQNANGTIDITNDGNNGITIGGSVLNANGAINIANNNTSSSAITTTADSTIQNDNGTIDITNEGGSGINIGGNVLNTNGTINVVNNNAQGGITIENTAVVRNNKGGNIFLDNSNAGRMGIIVKGIVNSLKDQIIIVTNDSDLVIGDANTDFNINASDNDVSITVKNGNVRNAGVNKTLIAAGKNLTINVEDGDIGKTTHALAGMDVGVGINASTRDNTESVNIKIAGIINAKAKNKSKADDRLINLNAKKSGMNINQIESDGNVMLTVAEWDTEDRNPTPGEYTVDNYFTGYSILNANPDKTQPNVIGKNISIISSDNVGASNNWFTYTQTGGRSGSISVEAENNMYLKSVGNEVDSFIWQLISKRGNMALDFNGNTEIREITAGKDLTIIERGAKLVIYDLGKISHILDPLDDILYPHDLIKMGDVVPETINIAVLDINPITRVDVNKANSILNIYNAYVRGTSTGKTDVTLAADNIIAHAYEAPDSIVGTIKRPNGFDASEGRDYNDKPGDTSTPLLYATGFNTSGPGKALVFDITGVSPDLVQRIAGNTGLRDYKPQEVINTIQIFDNILGFKDTVYKADDVTLSLNSSSQSVNDNRGMVLNKFYANNAYVDTKDLNIDIKDGFITNYAEFINGNRGGEPGGHYLSAGNRWRTIIDNDFRRQISHVYGIPVTAQLYTQKTGSFALHIGNLIDMLTKAPVVHYDPYEVVNIPRTENSFYRLTYKDDKIQKTTTTPEFEDIDKSTYKPTKRNNIRFTVDDINGYVLVSNNTSDAMEANDKSVKIASIIDISKGGLAIEYEGNLKIGDTFKINLDCHNIQATPEVEVVRVNGKFAGLRFINIDEATANKILYMNMYLSTKDNPSISKN